MSAKKNKKKNELERFSAWVSARGGEVLVPTNEWELVRRGRGSLLLADLRPHVEALAVTDQDPAYKALLERVDGFLHTNLEQSQEKTQ